VTVLAVVVQLTRGYPTWLFASLFFVCVGLVAFFYVNHARTLPRWYFNALLGLRVLVVILLLLFIFRPELRFQRLFTRRPTMLVLLDTSESMSHADPGSGKRLDVAKSNVRQGGLLSDLQEQFQVHLYTFGATAEPVSAGKLADVEATGESTDLVASCAAAVARHPERRAAGLVLLTDGIDNSGKRPEEKLPELGIPIHPVAFGARLEEQKDFKNVAITDLVHDRFVAKDNTTEIQVLVDAVGYGNRAVRVVFRDKVEDEELAAKELVLDTKKGAQRVVLPFTPKEMGRIDGVIEVQPFPDEVRPGDNREPITINVTGPKIKVLYIEGVLRAEGKWLMRALQTDPNVELLYLVKAGQGRFLQRGNIKNITLDAIPRNLETWEKFDVIILGDVHRSLFTDNQLLDLKEAVLDGRGLLLMGGVTALGPGKYAGTPVEELAPVWLGSATIGQVNDAFSWTLTDDGMVHPIFSGITQYFPTRDAPAETAMQNLAGCTRVGARKPTAADGVLTVHPSEKGPDGKPLVVVAVHTAGSGRTMVVTADTTHRWYLPNRGLGRESPYIKFWGQSVRWLASEEVKRSDKPGIDAYTDKGEYEPGEEVMLQAYVRDRQGQATDDASVTVSVLSPTKERTKILLPNVDGKLGEYRFTFRPSSPGEHEAVFEAKLGGEALGEPKTVTFTVGRPDLEMAELSLNEKLLKQIADATGGSYCSWLGVKDLARGLTAAQDRKTEPVKFKLHHGPAFLIAFILIAACEWYLRKRIQLA
jgi:uncharacterized membrane protein